MRRLFRRCKQVMPLMVIAALPLARPASAQFSGPPRADSTVRTLITRLVQRDTVGLRLPFDSASLAAQAISRDSVLRLLWTGLDLGAVETLELVDRAEWRPFSATRVDEQLTYHLVGREASRLVFASAAADSGRVTLTGLRWEAAARDLREMNPFTLQGKAWYQYLVLGAVIVVPLFSLGTAIAAVRSGIGRRWLWALGCVVGVGKLTIAWVDASLAPAQWSLMPLQVQLLGAGVVKYPMYAPWALSVSVPICAIAYWVLSQRRQRARLGQLGGAA